MNIAKNNRIKIKQKKDFLEINISLKKNFTILFFMILATILWAAVLFLFVNMNIKLLSFWFKIGGFMVIASWSFIGIIGASFFLWFFFGKEKIIITEKYFIIDKPLVFYFRRSFYKTTEIKNLKIDSEIFKVNRNNKWMDESRIILSFNTDDKHVIFGRGITKEVAEEILLSIATSHYLQKNQFDFIQKI